MHCDPRMFAYYLIENALIIFTDPGNVFFTKPDSTGNFQIVLLDNGLYQTYGKEFRYSSSSQIKKKKKLNLIFQNYLCELLVVNFARK
jgi:hypothetical protein